MSNTNYYDNNRNTPDVDDKNKMSLSPLLLVGIIFVPYIFGWVLLSDAYKLRTRVIGLLWTAFVLFTYIYTEYIFEPKTDKVTNQSRSLLSADAIDSIPDKPLIISKFENSDLYKSQSLKSSKAPRPINGGLIDYAYAFNDNDSFSNLSVEILTFNEELNSVSLSWYGDSANKPAQWSEEKEKFLQNFINALDLKVSFNDIKKLIIDNQNNNYDGGSNDMPRTKVGDLKVYTGLSTSKLIVGFEVASNRKSNSPNDLSEVNEAITKPSTGQDFETSTIVDCTELSAYAQAKGHSFMERAMIVDEARREGNCR